jgi:hypothetical protein
MDRRVVQIRHVRNVRDPVPLLTIPVCCLYYLYMYISCVFFNIRVSVQNYNSIFTFDHVCIDLLKPKFKLVKLKD